ncbi:hypothetical protein [Actinoplanes cyaneus]|uniref:hypothetical protein n=1 Tax=Actinoplanes cyaneus TaxID=52696 RepID=UPI00194177B4|nr:hypothetical protein [Actinoplanes cyaneus]
MTKLVEAAAKFVSDYAVERAKVAAAVTQRREELAFERERRHEDAAGAERLERMRLAADAEAGRMAALRDRLRDAEQRLHETYPVRDGPGTLRTTLLQTGSEHSPLVVLLALPQSDADNPSWNGLRLRVHAELMQYQNQGLIRIRMPERPFQWPHAALYEYDLAGIPTLVLQIAVDRRYLSVYLGGCDLRVPGLQENMRIYGMRASSKEDWTEVEVTQINATSTTGQRFRLRRPEDEEDLRELDHELASRAISLVVATAIDAFYLMHREAYAEQIDNAITGASLVADDWPADLSMDLDLVVDPAYHLMHSAGRHLRRGNPDAAVRDLRRACVVLLGAPVPDETDTATVLRRAVLSTAPREHHRTKLYEVVTKLPESYAPRAELFYAITTPAPAPVALPPEPAPPVRPVRTPPMNRPAATPGYPHWTERNRRSPLDDD